MGASTQKFWKIHGCGNDSVVIADLENSGTDWQTLSPKILDRHYGVGADALMILKRSEKADFLLETYNPDGSDGVLCGNGTRCSVRFLFLEEILKKGEGSVCFETSTGLKIPCTLKESGKIVNVMLGSPIFEVDQIPFHGTRPEAGIEIDIGNDSYHVYPLRFGTPRSVIFVPNLSALDLEKIGPLIEHHSAFPDRTNVDFVEVLSREKIRLRTWERGAGATLACATGSCAAAVISILKKEAANTLQVQQQSGDILTVKWDRGSNEVWLEGPAEEVFSGEFSI